VLLWLGRAASASCACIHTRPEDDDERPHGHHRRRHRRVEALGLPRIRLHDLRHTWATLALQGGVHPKIVQERLGHSSIAVTLDIYSHVSQPMASDAAERLAAVIFGAL
jgi:integrase